MIADPFASFRNSNHKKIRFIEISIVLFTRNKNYSVCRLKCTNTRKGKYSKKKKAALFFASQKMKVWHNENFILLFRVGLIPKPDRHIFLYKNSLFRLNLFLFFLSFFFINSFGMFVLIYYLYFRINI